MSDGRDVIYLYDGSFDGLLSAVFDCYYNREIPSAIEVNDNVQENLFCDCITIVTDSKKAQRVSDSIKKKISYHALQNLYCTFLSDTPGKGRICFDYIRTGYRLGKKTDMYLTVDCVARVNDAVRRIGNEAHQYMQFVRFSELDGGIYYSEIEPKSDVLPLIAHHFAARLPGMPWIIHDIRRRKCIVYNGKECYIAPTDSIPQVKYSDDEKHYRRLWKEFYDSIEIKERHNEHCRTSHMPIRYRNHMTEFLS